VTTSERLLFLVKRNDGKNIRLTKFFDVLTVKDPLVPPPYLEIEIRAYTVSEASHPLWRPYQLVWFHPLNAEAQEATLLDESARQQYEKAIAILDKLPDITFENPRNGSLILIEGDKDHLTFRTLKPRQVTLSGPNPREKK
jgi:hypothetical protein